MKEKIILTDITPISVTPDAKELANVIISRIGLCPRKKGSTENMYKTLIEIYERTKRANQEKRPELAVMTVDEMGQFAGITRQTMYEYLDRWTTLDLIIKTSYIYEGKVVIGYKLNGNTLETAFERVLIQIKNHMEITQKYIRDLQKTIKNEKLSLAQKIKQAGIVNS